MKRLVFLLIAVILLAACGGKVAEAPIPIPTPVPPCKTQLNVRVGYYNDEFVEVSSESHTVKLEYDEWYKEFYIPDGQKEPIYYWQKVVESRLHDHFLNIPVEREYQRVFIECPQTVIEVIIWVYWDHVRNFTQDGISVRINSETLEQIIKGEEIPQRLPSATPVTPEEFSATVTKATATYQIPASEIGRATKLFNLAAQQGEYEFITTLSDDSLWGALIPIN